MSDPTTHEEALAQLEAIKAEIDKLEKLEAKLEAQRDRIQNRLSTVLYAREDRLERIERVLRPISHKGMVTVVIYHSWPPTSMGSGDGGWSNTFLSPFDSLEEAQETLKRTHKTNPLLWEAYEVDEQVVGQHQHIGDGTRVYILFGDVRMNPPYFGFKTLKWEG